MDTVDFCIGVSDLSAVINKKVLIEGEIFTIKSNNWGEFFLINKNGENIGNVWPNDIKPKWFYINFRYNGLHVRHKISFFTIRTNEFSSSKNKELA